MHVSRITDDQRNALVCMGGTGKHQHRRQEHETRESEYNCNLRNAPHDEIENVGPGPKIYTTPQSSFAIGRGLVSRLNEIK
jgi:hypothetical protein